MEDARIKEIFLLWNKVDRRISPLLIKQYNQHIKEENLILFDSKIYASVKISHELAEVGVKKVFRSTYLPPNIIERKGTGIDEFIEELLTKIELVKL